MSVIRVSHQDNYVVIKKTALEDGRLSFKAKGLWAYCMSRPNHWEFHASQLAQVSKEKIRSIYSTLNELIELGYCKRTQNNKKKGERKGREGFGQVEYTVYEEPQQIENLSEPDAHTQNVHAQNAHVQNSTLVSIDTHQVLKENKLSPSADALELESSLLNKIKELNPGFKDPKPQLWAKDIDKMLGIDKRDPEQIKKLIDWIFEDEFWKTKILSGNKLRKHFDALWMRSCSDEKSGKVSNSVIEKRKEWAKSHEFTSHAGYWVAGPIGMTTVSGSRETLYPYNQDSAFWKEHGL